MFGGCLIFIFHGAKPHQEWNMMMMQKVNVEWAHLIFIFHRRLRSNRRWLMKNKVGEWWCEDGAEVMIILEMRWVCDEMKNIRWDDGEWTMEIEVGGEWSIIEWRSHSSRDDAKWWVMDGASTVMRWNQRMVMLMRWCKNRWWNAGDKRWWWQADDVVM